MKSLLSTATKSSTRPCRDETFRKPCASPRSSTTGTGPCCSAPPCSSGVGPERSGRTRRFLVRTSGLPALALIDAGNDHRLADPEPLAAMLEARKRAANDGRSEKWTRRWRAIASTRPAAMPWLVPPATCRRRNSAGLPAAPSRQPPSPHPRRCWGRVAPSAGVSPGIPPVATARRGA